jgi:hypothetical protein
MLQPSLRDSYNCLDLIPSDESLGYYQMSLTGHVMHLIILRKVNVCE